MVYSSFPKWNRFAVCAFCLKHKKYYGKTLNGLIALPVNNYAYSECLVDNLLFFYFFFLIILWIFCFVVYTSNILRSYIRIFCDEYHSSSSESKNTEKLMRSSVRRNNELFLKIDENFVKSSITRWKIKNLFNFTRSRRNTFFLCIFFIFVLFLLF